MVKYTVPNPKLSYTCKNLIGIDTVLRIEKQEKNVIITLEQNVISPIYWILIRWWCIAFVLFLVQLYLLNNSHITKWGTAAIITFLLFELKKVVLEESLIMVHTLGYQLRSKYLVGHKDLFIPWKQVQSIFINEVIVRHKVIFLLTILTKEENNGDKLIPLFVRLQPRLKQLELICKHLRDARS